MMLSSWMNLLINMFQTNLYENFMNVWKMLQGKYMKALIIVYMHVQLCDKRISHLRRHAKLNGCSLLMFEKQ